ncbi:MAG TPA: DUF1579 family protein [Acidimicrobiia bacterium]
MIGVTIAAEVHMTVEAAVAAIPRPITPGWEHTALRRFHRDGTWEGLIHAGGMGPGTPVQKAIGTATHHWIQDGRWVVGDYAQDQFLEDGTFVLKWELHWVCGWDPMAGEYRATIADNYGRADVLSGRIDGDVLVFESAPGRFPRIRLTWEATDPEVVL